MAAAFPFSYDNTSTGGANGGHDSSSLLKCDLCNEQPGSLSELRTLPCLHTLCKKCFRFRQISPECCPICGCRINVAGGGGGPPMLLKASAMPSAFGATSSSSSSGNAPSGQSHSSHMFSHDAFNVEQLNVDTSFLIGNLLETVSLDDSIVPSQAQLGGTNVRSYSTSSSSSSTGKHQHQPHHHQQHVGSGGGLHRSALSAATAQQQQQQQAEQQQQSLKLYIQQQQQQQQQSKLRSAMSTQINAPQQQQQQSSSLFSQQQQQRPLLFFCSCAEGVEAVSRCEDCDELLCANCVQAHMRVRLTKDHRVYRLTQQQTQMSHSLRALSGVLSSASSFGSFPTTTTTTSSATTGILPLHASTSSSMTSSTLATSSAPSFSNNYCSTHRDELLNFYCDTCSSTLCRQCAHNVEHAGHQVQYTGASVDFLSTVARQQQQQRNVAGGAQLPALVGELRQIVKQVEDTGDVVERMTERVETRVMSVSNEIRAVVHHHISALEERKRDLLQRVDAVRAAKVNALCAQRDELRSHQAKLRAALDSVDSLLSSGNEQDANKAKEQLYEQIAYAKNVRPFVQQHEDDRVVFIGPEAPLLAALRNLGSIVTGAFAPNSVIIGDIYRRAIKDKAVVYTVQTKDHVGESCTVGGDQVNVIVQTPDGYHFNGEVNDKKNGTYLCSFKPTMEGKHLIYIFIRAKPIHGSPFSLLVRKGRDYASLGAHPIFSFGIEGTDEGQLCRPWGITCDKQNRIIIADRSNNRIQVFDQTGKFLHKFGSPGCRNGQFDRPAGVAVNSKNQIIVVDKDNHRVQVFNAEGQFLFKFGEKGRSPGQFNYPWDCAVSSDDSIAVSDTRNHRVQLFNGTGVFMKKFGFESSLLFKQFDSPRGLVFAPDGRLLVTDFNNHRLVIIDLVHDQLDFVGREGEYEGCFRRPQGIDVDLDGAILVADSRNNRIQAFSPQMQFVGSFGVDTGPPGRSRALMDRPCDLCVTPDGRIFVVDFGNNKIHVF